MNSETPLSIILVTYNVEKFISNTLQSLYDQTYKNFEVIVIDDGSTDSTVEKILSYKALLNINLVRSEHIGNIGMQRNKAMKLAKNDFIHFVDGDDVWEPDKLQITQRSFNDKVKLVCTNVKLINENSEVTNEKWFNTDKFDVNINIRELIKFNFIVTSSVAIKKELITEGVRFEQEEGFKGEDYILWLKILEDHEGIFIDIPLVRYRIHQNNISSGTPELRIGILKMTLLTRQSYFSYKDHEVRRNAKLGCEELHKELTLIYLDMRKYKEAYYHLMHLSFNPAEMGFKSFLKYGCIFCFLFLINGITKLKSS